MNVDPYETYSMADRETEVWKKMQGYLDVGRKELQALARHFEE